MINIVDKKEVNIRHYVCVPNRWKNKNKKKKPISEDDILQIPNMIYTERELDISELKNEIKNLKIKNNVQELDISKLKNEIKNIKTSFQELEVTDLKKEIKRLASANNILTKKNDYLSSENIILSEEISILRENIYSIVRENIRIKNSTVKCVRCEKYVYLQKENYHHVIPRKYNGDDDDYNRIPLCSECHDYVEIKTEEWISLGKKYDIEKLIFLIKNDIFD